jgi:two-component system, NarL family, response regulator DevR
MPVKVLVADTDFMRKAILCFLSDLPEITVIGEAATLPEAVSKTTRLHPDVVVLDLNLSDGVTPTHGLFNARVVATSLRIDDESKTLAEIIGAAKLLDKMELASELIPAILQLSPVA